jgi:hypothetical protein
MKVVELFVNVLLKEYNIGELIQMHEFSYL